MVSKEKYGVPELFKLFKSKYNPTDLREMNLDKKKHNAILYEFNKEISNLIISENVEFEMPYRIGRLRIRKYKKRLRLTEDGNIDKSGLSIDWPATKKLWEQEYPGKTSAELKQIKNKPLVYHLNEHTNGFRYMLYWNKKGSNTINRKVFSIRFTRENDRLLAKVLKTNPDVNYYE